MRKLLIIGLPILLGGCAQTDTMKVSRNEVIINTSAAPICGGNGAAKVAEKMAAIETIRAGYDRYVIVGAQRSNNTRVVQTGGTVNTFGTVNSYGNNASFGSTSTYTPNYAVRGSHDQSIAVRMFKNAEPGADSAISARDILGPKWENLAKDGISTCLS
jgi:hypothetical protein